MRLLGAGFLWISLTFLGVAYAHKLKSRIILLEKTKYFISQLAVETEYLQLSAGEILFRLSDSPQLRKIDFINDICLMLSENEDFPKAWKKAIENSVLNYKIAEKEKLLQLGLDFGTTDIKNQLSMLKIYESYFEEFLSEAKDLYMRQAKMSTLLGSLIGCMLFILLI